MNAHDIELALRSRAAFNDSVERLDVDTRRRLREARLRAQQGKPQHVSARWVWPAGAALTAALALAVFLPTLPRAPTAAIPTASTDVAPQRPTPASAGQQYPSTVAETAPSDSIDASATETPAVESADPDMLSDLDFYGWLAKQQASGKTGG